MVPGLVRKYSNELARGNLFIEQKPEKLGIFGKSRGTTP
jgi:hypothetical protein